MSRFALVLFVAARMAAQSPDPADPRVDVDFQVRVRGENLIDDEVDETLDDGLFLTRVRAGIGVRAHQRLRFFVQGQDSRYPWNGPENLPNGDRRRTSLRQAYVEAGAPSDFWTLRAGRQAISYGNERLFGERRWSNVSPTWDGARLRLRHGASRVDLFSLKFAHLPPDDDDEALRGTNVHGVYGSIADLGPRFTLQPYWFYTRRSQTPEVIQYDLGTGFSTAGFRLERAAAFGYELELALQRGHTRNHEMRGWMGSGVLTIAPDAWAWHSAARATFEAASGDGDPNDDRVGTWDQLNPARHSHLGRADFVGRRNIRSLKLGWEAFPVEPLRLRFDHVQHWLARRTDAIYETDAETFAVAPPGGFEHAYLGGELDLILTYSLRDDLPVEVGVLRFFPGGAVREAREDPVPQTLVYLSVRWTL